jgi:hypothetical protein
MRHRPFLHGALRAAIVCCALAPRTVVAQAWVYPSFQPPRVVAREYNFGFADGAGTTLLFQWREGRSLRNQLSLDVGFTDNSSFRGADVFFVGGQFAHQLAVARAEMPFDLLWTLGANAAFSNPSNYVRVPVGLSIGHRFPLEGGMAITPYAHPRLSVDFCSDCQFVSAGVFHDSHTDVAISFDLGASFEFSRQFAARISAQFGSSENFPLDDNAFGVSLAWRPPGLGLR